MKYLTIPVLVLALAASAGTAMAGGGCSGMDRTTEQPKPTVGT